MPAITGIYTRLVEHNRDYWLRRFADDRAGRTDLFAIPTATSVSEPFNEILEPQLVQERRVGPFGSGSC